MALIKCPECGKEISDKAKTCPNCGCPIKKITGTENEILEQTEVGKQQYDIVVQKPRKKISKKSIIIIGTIISSIIIGVIVYLIVTADSRKYDNAQELYSSEEYEDALTEFKELGTYKNSADMVEKCEYALSADGQFLNMLRKSLMARWDLSEDGKTEEAFIHMQDTGLTGREAGDFPVNHMDRTPQMPKEEGSLNIVKTVNIAQRRKRGWISAFLRGLIKTWELFTAFCIWWIRLFWNLLWLFMALFFGGMALITLAGVGVILVLLPQGYPMVGMLLICLGGMLCMGTLCCGSYSLILRRKKEEQETEKRKTEKRETEKQEKEKRETAEQETEAQGQKSAEEVY